MADTTTPTFNFSSAASQIHALAYGRNSSPCTPPDKGSVRAQYDSICDHISSVEQSVMKLRQMHAGIGLLLDLLQQCNDREDYIVIGMQGLLAPMHEELQRTAAALHHTIGG